MALENPIEKFYMQPHRKHLNLKLILFLLIENKGDSPSNLNNWEEELDRDKSLWMEKYQPSQTFKAIKAQYIYQDFKILAPALCFAELVETSLWEE